MTPCQLPVSRSWALGWHETWLETLLSFLPFREPEAAHRELGVQGLPFHDLLYLTLR